MKLISDYNYIGPSMQPLLLPGDGIIIAPDVNFESFRVGDVICYQKPDDPAITVVHRIVGFNNKRAITRGDNNSEIDSYTVTATLNPQRRPFNVERVNVRGINVPGLLRRRLPGPTPSALHANEMSP